MIRIFGPPFHGPSCWNGLPMNFVHPSSSPTRLAPSFWLQLCTTFGRSEIEESSTTVQDPTKRSVLSYSSRFETRSPIWALILQSQKPRGVCGTWTTCSLFLLCFSLWAASNGSRCFFFFFLGSCPSAWRSSLSAGRRAVTVGHCSLDGLHGGSPLRGSGLVFFVRAS